MEFQGQQDSEGVRLEGKARSSFRMELQGQKDAEGVTWGGVRVRMEGEDVAAYRIELQGRQDAGCLVEERGDILDVTLVVEGD